MYALYVYKEGEAGFVFVFQDISFEAHLMNATFFVEKCVVVLQRFFWALEVLFTWQTGFYKPS